MALGMALKFDTSMVKELKLEVRNIWRLILTFVEVREERLIGLGRGAFPSILNWGKQDQILK